MTNEETVQQEIQKKFPALATAVTIQRARRIMVEAPYASFDELFHYATTSLGFTILCTITGLDEGDKFSFIYYLARKEGMMLNIKTSVRKDNPVIKTITHLFPNAEIYERELVDLLGVRVDGLKEGKRYPLPDNWPAGQYPLRKDWKGLPGEAKETPNA